MKKNIVFFLTDQQHFKTIQENGCPEALTPNMDRLAREGINFQNHYVTNPVCSPSRGTIWTGKYPSENGLYGNGCTLPDSETTLPMVLGDNGYATGHVGKLHLEPTVTHIEFDKQFGFDHCLIAEGDQFLTHDAYNIWLRKQDPEAFQQYYYQMGLKGHMDPYVANIPEELSMNAWVTQESIEWVKKQSAVEKPFFLSMGYFDPHHAWNPCEPYATDFAFNEVSRPTYDPNDILLKPEHWGTESEPHDPFYISNIIRSYHAMIKHLDDCLGRLIDALEASGELENTIIVFSSDHGEFLGNHGKLFKGPFLCDDLLKVPMIIWDGAGRNKVKGKTDVLTSSVDFFATFQSLAGIEQAACASGTPIVDSELNIAPNGERDNVIAEWRMHPDTGEALEDILSIRTKDNRYVWYANSGDEELYIHSVDPFELKNEASDNSRAALKKVLKEKLLQEAPAKGKWPAPTSPW